MRFPSRSPLALWLVVTIVASLPLAVRRAEGQTEQTSPDTLLTASLLRRLSEAVDGTRTGGLVWVVASYDFPYTVYGVTVSLDEAGRLKASGRGHIGIFGPYRTVPDSGVPQPKLLVLVHRPDSKFSLDSTSNMSSVIPPVPLVDVQEITLAIKSKSGTQSVTLSPNDVDAVFFTLSAVDKFTFPFYIRLYGTEYVARQRRNLVNQLSH